MVTGNEVSARRVVGCRPEGFCVRKFEACHHICRTARTFVPEAAWPRRRWLLKIPRVETVS